MSVGSKVTDLIENKMLRSFGLGSILNAYFTVDAYKQHRDEGHGAVGSAIRAGAEMVIMDTVSMPLYIGAQVIEAAPSMAVSGYEALSRQARSMSAMGRQKAFNNAQFNDSRQAATMRQAGMQMAKASKYNTQQALLGNEAQYLHL